MSPPVSRNSAWTMMRTLLLCTAMMSTCLSRTWLDTKLGAQLGPGLEDMMLFRYAIIFYFFIMLFIKTFFKMKKERCVFIIYAFWSS